MRVPSPVRVKPLAMKNAATIAVAKIQALTKGVVSANEAEVESIALAHEAEQNALQQQHEKECRDGLQKKPT